MPFNRTQKRNDRVLIMGIGNLLMGDEGLGVHLARAMEKEALPEKVDILDGGTAGFNLMSYFEKYPLVVMVDATLDGRTPGTIRKVTPRFSKDFPPAMSTHDIGLKDLIEGLNILDRLPEIRLFVVSIAEVQPLHIGMSPEVEAVFPELIRRVKQEVSAQAAEIA